MYGVPVSRFRRKRSSPAAPWYGLNPPDALSFSRKASPMRAEICCEQNQKSQSWLSINQPVRRINAHRSPQTPAPAACAIFRISTTLIDRPPPIFESSPQPYQLRSAVSLERTSACPKCSPPPNIRLPHNHALFSNARNCPTFAS